MVFLLLLAAGIAIWPVVIYGLSMEGIAALCQSALTTNLILLTVYVLCAAVLLWFDRNFSMLKTALLNLGLGGMVNLILLLTWRIDIPSNTGVDFMLTLLWFICSFFLAGVLALLPALAVAGIAKIIHSVFFLIHR